MAKELIQSLLKVDPKERLTAAELLKHPWIVGHDTPRKNLPATIDSIKKYKQYKIKVSEEGYGVLESRDCCVCDQHVHEAAPRLQEQEYRGLIL